MNEIPHVRVHAFTVNADGDFSVSVFAHQFQEVRVKTNVLSVRALYTHVCSVCIWISGSVVCVLFIREILKCFLCMHAAATAASSININVCNMHPDVRYVALHNSHNALACAESVYNVAWLVRALEHV